MVSLLSALLPATPTAGPSPAGRSAVDPAVAAGFGALLAITPDPEPANPTAADAVTRQPLAVPGNALPLPAAPVDEVPPFAHPTGKPPVSTRAILLAQLSPTRAATSTPAAILVAGPTTSKPTVPTPTGILVAAPLAPLIYVDDAPAAAPPAPPSAAPLAPLIYVDGTSTSPPPGILTAAPLDPLIYVDGLPSPPGALAAAPLDPLIYVDGTPPASPVGGSLPINEAPVAPPPVVTRRVAMPEPLQGIDDEPIILVDDGYGPVEVGNEADAASAPIASDDEPARGADQRASVTPLPPVPDAALIATPMPIPDALRSTPVQAAVRPASPASPGAPVAPTDAALPIASPASGTTAPPTQAVVRDRGFSSTVDTPVNDAVTEPSRRASPSTVETPPVADLSPTPPRPEAEPTAIASPPPVAAIQLLQAAGAGPAMPTTSPSVIDAAQRPSGDADAPDGSEVAAPRVPQPRRPVTIGTVAGALPPVAPAPPVARTLPAMPSGLPAARATTPAPPVPPVPGRTVVTQDSAPTTPAPRPSGPPVVAVPTPTIPPLDGTPIARTTRAPVPVDAAPAPATIGGDRVPAPTAEEPAPRPTAPRAEPAFRAFAAAMFDAATAVAPATPAAPAPDAAPLDLTRAHWPQAMVDRIERLRDEASLGDTRIRLIPDALGTIDVALRRDGDTVHVAFRADQAETRQLLADARPELSALAEARGIKLAETAPAPIPTGGWTGTPSNPGQGFAGDRAPRQQPQPSTPAAPPRAAVAAEEPGDDTRIA